MLFSSRRRDISPGLKPLSVLRGCCLNEVVSENAPQTPINVNLSSSPQQPVFSKGLREHSTPYSSSTSSILKAAAAPGGLLRTAKAQSIHGGLIQQPRMHTLQML